MPIPDYQSLMLPVLSAASLGEVAIYDVVDRVADQFGLTPEDRASVLPSGKQTVFSNRVRWARTYLGKAGLIEATRRGHFKITQRGEEVIKSSPARIDNGFLSQFDEFRQFKEKSARDSVEQPEDQLPAMSNLAGRSETPDETMRIAYRQIESSLAQELLERVRV